MTELYYWLSFTPNLTVQYSPTVAYSAKLLCEFAKREPFGRNIGRPTTPDRVEAAKRPSQLVRNWPGVDPANRSKLFERFGSVHGIASASRSELCDAIGVKRGGRLFDLLRQEPT